MMLLWVGYRQQDLTLSPFKCQPHLIVKHTQTIIQMLTTNCLNMFNHFMRLALIGLTLFLTVNEIPTKYISITARVAFHSQFYLQLVDWCYREISITNSILNLYNVQKIKFVEQVLLTDGISLITLIKSLFMSLKL